jgi:Flp pilus assembly secretin CpaC
MVTLVLAEPSASKLFKLGRKSEKKGDFVQAYLLYAQAAAADPNNSMYWQRSQALQRKATLAANVMPNTPGVISGIAAESAAAAALEDPVDMPSATGVEIEEARRPQPPIELNASNETKSFDIRDNPRKLFEEISKAYGLDVIFDGDYPASGPPIRFRLDDAGFREALHALMSATGSFIVPISGRVVMVVKDTEQKRREVENTIAVTVPIPEPLSVQEAQEVARSVQQLMEIQRFAIDSSQRLVFMRDRMSKIWPARELLLQLMHRRPEIALEVDMMTVSKKSSLALGLNPQTSFPLVAFGDFGKSQPYIPPGFTNFFMFGGGKTLIGLGIASAQLVATMTKSEATTSFHTEMRSVDGMPATFHAGDKYPIMTVGYFGNTSGGGQVFTPPPTFQFEDLGLVLKITPKIHDTKEVTLDVEAEFKLLGSQSLNGIPVISNRKFASRVRLLFNESAIIGGLVTSSEVRSIAGIAGLSGLPVLGYLTSQTTKDKEQTEGLLVIKPRLLSLPPSESQTPAIWIGAESRLRTVL